MRRIALNVLAAVSALLFVATCVLWVWSYFQFVDAGRMTTTHTPEVFTQHYIRLGAIDGRFIFTWRDIIWPAVNSSKADVEKRWDKENGTYLKLDRRFDINEIYPKAPNDRSWEFRFAGFRLDRKIQDAGSRYRGMIGVVIYVPQIYLLALFAVYPTVVAAKWRRERRSRKGFCPSCGYDLRATPERCPECGTTLARK